MRTIRAKLTWAVSALVAVAACSPAADKGDRPLVVATAWPVSSLVGEIVGERLEVADLARPGVEPHDLELTAADRSTLASADLVVFVGGGFQPAITEAIPAELGVDVLDASLLRGAEGEPVDPHVWLDPVNWAAVTVRLGEAMTDRFDDESFRSNAKRVAAEIENVDREFSAGLANCERTLVVTEHTAFGHLTDRYRLEQQGVTGIVPGAEATAQRLASLQKLIETEGVTTVFAERGRGGRLAAALAEVSGVEVLELDPLEFHVVDGETYRTRMQANLTALREGLGCP